MTFSVLIRPALPSDVAAVIPLFEELDEIHRLALPAVFRKPDGARREQSWLDGLIAGPDQAILVAEGPHARYRRSRRSHCEVGRRQQRA
jgi:hypothetical protein